MLLAGEISAARLAICVVNARFVHLSHSCPILFVSHGFSHGPPETSTKGDAYDSTQVKCSGSRPKCDRCTRLAKNCVFSVARPRPAQPRAVNRPRSKVHDRFIYVDPETYRSGNNSNSTYTDNISNSQHAATKERPGGHLRRESSGHYSEDPRSGGVQSWSEAPPPRHAPLHHHHLPTPSMAAAAVPETRPPSQAHSVAMESDVDMTFQQTRRTSSSSPSEAHPSVSDDSWYWNNVPEFSDHNDSSNGMDISRTVPDDLAFMTSWGSLVEDRYDRDKSEQQLAPTANTLAHALSVSALRSHSPSRRVDSHPNPSTTGTGAAAGALSSPLSSRECTCVQQLTLSLFDLSTWKADQQPGASASADFPTLSEYFVIYRNSMDLWARLTRGCVRCLFQPQFAQLLILNIEQLVHLQRNQQSLQRRCPSSLALSDVITIGEFVVESHAEKAAIIGQILKVRAATLIEFIDSLRELLLPAGVPDLRVRLDSITEKLRQRRLDSGSS